MKDYYSILEIPKSALKTEIKKAYFRMVRKYPPDRFPEDFKKIREAYEVLFDDHTRIEYDSIENMPEIVRLYYNRGKQAMEVGSYDQAVKLLKEVTKVYPDFSVVNSLLGDAALENGNSGTAVEIFKKLVAQEPGNASFSGKLAQAYLERGWQKKAIEQFNTALSLDEDNVSLWDDLIEAHAQNNDLDHAAKTAWDAIEVSKRNDWDNLPICTALIHLSLRRVDPDDLDKVLKEIRISASRYSDEKDNLAWFLANVAKMMRRNGFTEIAATVIETAHELIPDEEEINDFMKEIQDEHNVRQILRSLSNDAFFPPHYTDMIEYELDREMGLIEPDDPEFDRFTMEMDVIYELDSERKYVRRLRRKYPELYRYKEQFFNRVLNISQAKNLEQEYYKKYTKYEKLYPDIFVSSNDNDYIYDDDEEEAMQNYEVYAPQEPVRREGPKIGRNDPCPCGSGKKYKKCCGNLN